MAAQGPAVHGRSRRAAPAMAAAAEAVTLDDIGSRVLPALADAVAATVSVLWGRPIDGGPDTGTGSLAWFMPKYVRDHAARDPQAAIVARHRRLPVVRLSRFVDMGRFRRTDFYRDCYEPLGLNDVLSCRIAGYGYLEPGSARAALFRVNDQPEFGPGDEQTLDIALPAVRAAARRAERLEPLLRAQPAMETLLESLSPQPTLVLDAMGRLLWISPRAERLLPTGPGGRVLLPDTLEDAARRLDQVSDTGATEPPLAAALTIPGRGPVPLRVQPFIVRTPSAGRVLVVEIEDFTQPGPVLAEVAASHGLTRAETAVLGALTLGLTNDGVARRLAVSVETVRSHVARILRKLEVPSRSDAILLARRGSRDEG